jgi:hypothetical protein
MPRPPVTVSHRRTRIPQIGRCITQFVVLPGRLGKVYPVQRKSVGHAGPARVRRNLSPHRGTIAVPAFGVDVSECADVGVVVKLLDRIDVLSRGPGSEPGTVRGVENDGEVLIVVFCDTSSRSVGWKERKQGGWAYASYKRFHAPSSGFK